MKTILIKITFFLLGTSFIIAQENSTKKTELNEVAVTKIKKAVETKADRTIFDFANQSHLNSGSVLEGIKKLPGLVASDVAGMMYQGKLLDVYMDGRPLNISSNELNAFLEGMPANAVEKIEIITQPGAEYPATSGGAILNIITNREAKKYLSATYTNSTNITNYDHLRWRVNNSLLLNAKNKYFGWQLNLGQNYRENAVWNSLLKNEANNSILLSQTDADRIGRSSYIKSGLTFDIGKDRLLLNYDINYNINTTNTMADGFDFQPILNQSYSKANRQDVAANYQKKFSDVSKKLDFKFNYNKNRNNFNLNSVPSLENSSVQNLYNFKIDYSQAIKILDEGKVNFGTLYESLSFETKNKGVQNLDYKRLTFANYFELQSKFKKFEFILGIRTEDYNITGKTDTGNLTPFNQFRVFPNASLQYYFAKQIFFSANYNKKIALPSTTSLNPNNTNYQNPNVNYEGNPRLEPTIFNNYELKISAFDYAYIGYNVSIGSNQVINIITEKNNVVSNLNINANQIKTHSFNLGIPVPYMLFTKGIKEMMKFDFNPDKINFMYLYTGYQLHKIPEITNSKGYWIFNIMSQIVLPKDIKFVTNYSIITAGGNYFYYTAKKPFNNSLNLSFTKKFMKDQLTVAINADDILNTNQVQFMAFNTAVLLNNKNDTRRFGFTINYKIPTRNKSVKEDASILNKDKKDDNGVLLN